MKKKHTWIKVVVTIVVLEIFVGACFYAYKHLRGDSSVDSSVSEELYQKIAYVDFDFLDIKSNEAILYYAYHNAKNKSIACDTLTIPTETEEYQCTSSSVFVSEDDLKKAASDLYGPSVGITIEDFAVDNNHYAYYDATNQGVVVFERKELNEEAPVNLSLKNSEETEDQIILTVDVLDGILGDVISTYHFTFEKDGDDYYLVGRELVAE